MSDPTRTPTSDSSTIQATPGRARIACKACNARRVKCDAGSGQPCWHCRIRNTPCELIESKRGKYVRKKKRLGRDQRSHEPESPVSLALHPDTTHSTITSTPQNTARRDSFDGRSGHDQTGHTPHYSQPCQAPSDPHLGPDAACLTYTIEVDYTQRSGSTERLKVHYPIPAPVADRSTFHHGPGAEMVSLEEALALPPRRIADGLIRAFFELVHPAYPVFDRKRFTTLYHQGKASPLVLQTIFFMGFTVGPDSLIQESGYSSRTMARKTHYLRAKLLYDINYDADSLNVTASLLIIGFWWFGPEDQKENCYWVGCASNVAQSLGMHRSVLQSGMNQAERSLRKRIWWSIYTRDRHIAAAFGQPCRIRDEDCDVEPLTEEDFEFDSDCDQSLIPPQRDFNVLYVMEMSKLAIILGDILIGEFSPHRPALEKYETRNLARRLAEWELHLPDSLRRASPDGSLGAWFWASMLYIPYHNYHILLFRPKAIDNLSPAETERDMRARTAADSITRLAEDLLATCTIRSAQIHLLPALFGALSVHTIVICRKDLIRRKLAENKSRQCLLALSELSVSWPVRIWFARAFVNLMRRLTGRGGSIINVSSSIVKNRSNPAAFERVGSSESQHTAIMNESSHGPTANPMLPNFPGLSEPSTYFGYANDPYNLHHYAPQMPDQLTYDSFLAGYLDNTFDPDLLLYNSLEPMLPLSFGNIPDTERPNLPDS